MWDCFFIGMITKVFRQHYSIFSTKNIERLSIINKGHGLSDFLKNFIHITEIDFFTICLSIQTTNLMVKK